MVNHKPFIVKIEIPNNIVIDDNAMAIVSDQTGSYKKLAKINENMLVSISKVKAMHDGDGNSAYFNAFFKDNGDLIIHSVAEKQEF